ncbi:hypothetical protein CBR_g54887 [Chara braunii]|uniref:Uncharacterized protein n=1 Tax=Chara braunii TaxID=69332 RepID=A0A388JPQ6_CHABU|nr:hypothetical protein CBR_g54887 [Chara braunii]|eukprot:GBG59784.1 hypothetical protein CBR_g54887 [Chara braunii]
MAAPGQFEDLLYQCLDNTFGSKVNPIAGCDAEVDAPQSQGNCSDHGGHSDEMEGGIGFRLFRRSSGPIILEKGQVQYGRPKRMPRKRRTVEGYPGIDSSSDDDNDSDDADTLRNKNVAVKLQSVAVDYETVIANAARECTRLAARAHMQIQAEEEARRKEEERIAHLKKEKGETWLPAAQRKFSQGNKHASDTSKRFLGRSSHPVTAQSGSAVSGWQATLLSDGVLNSSGARIIGLGTVVRDWRDGAVEASIGCWEVDADVQTRRRQILLPRTPKVGTKREGGGCEMVDEQGKKRKKRRKKAPVNQCHRAAPPGDNAMQCATEGRSVNNQPASQREIATNVQVPSTGPHSGVETVSPVQVKAMELAELQEKEEEKKGDENGNKKKKKKRRNNEKKKIRKKEKRKEKKKKKKEEESRDVTKNVGSNAGCLDGPAAGISGP